MNKRKSALVASILAINTLLTACSSSSRKNEGYYNSEDYNIVFVDGKPHLTYNREIPIMFQLYSGEVSILDVNDDSEVAKYSSSHESKASSVFLNEVGSYITSYAYIPLSELFATDVFTQEMYSFLATESEEVDKFIEDNFLYNVVYRQEFNGEMYETYLGIYIFTNSITGDIEYHLGYNANRIYHCDFIYDIIDNKIYHKPELGSVTFIALSELTEQDKMTAADAKVLMNEYLSENQDRTLIQ